ncbi:MAG: LytTR family transcriptional regulator DNA-binding domain-containing protein [Bacteroidales bacterium]|nr:MAG: LytTR family transcriptional regulator DNA-binding domain-containing protein [Bacteroidales bacterium]
MKNSVKAIIVEDEELARNLIREYLNDYPEIVVIGEYADGFSGTKAINELKPDLVFLDIQMPKLTGFELLELLDYHPDVIFTTAYEQYAIEAFEKSAVDYLLKPYSRERFKKAVEKVLNKVGAGSDNMVDKLVGHTERSPEPLERIVVRSGKKIHVIPVSQVHYLEAQDDYVMIHSPEGRFLKQKTMNHFESHLDPKNFIRVHRSYIVNVSQIEKLELYEKETYLIHLKTGSKIPVSKSGLKKLKTGLDF